MQKSELPIEPDLTVPQIPVICDQCRQTGVLGEGPFSALPDILGFTPVHRRAHVNGWKPEHQRAFIAALAITGSPRQAARAIGRHQYGADQLRAHRTGKSFAAAWDAAMELAREREICRMQTSLAELAAEQEAAGNAFDGKAGQGQLHPDCDFHPDLHTDDYPRLWEAKERIRERLLNAHRLFLFFISDDEEKRRAWETLVGPTDWDKALQFEPQDDEPKKGELMNPQGIPSMANPDMVITTESGLLHELTDGPNIVAEGLAKCRAEQATEHRG